MAFHRYLTQVVANTLEHEGVDPYERRNDVPPDADEPDPGDPPPGTYGDFLKSSGEEFLGFYRACLGEGHTTRFAEVFAAKRVWDSYLPRLYQETYESLGADNVPWAPGHPAYDDVVQVCLAKGKGEDFARQCAEALPDHEKCFPEAFSATEARIRKVEAIRKKGVSEIYAVAFAKALLKYAEVDNTAHLYAEAFELLNKAGRSEEAADEIAYTFAHHFEGCAGNEDDDIDHEMDKERSLAHAEATHRFRNTRPEERGLREIFVRIFERRSPGDFSQAWCDGIEALAREVLAGTTDIKEIPLSSFMQFMEEESAREEANKPPDFSRMSEEMLLKSSPGAGEHYDAWVEECCFRDDCREAGYDPTDPEERERYEEILSETRGEW